MMNSAYGHTWPPELRRLLSSCHKASKETVVLLCEWTTREKHRWSLKTLFSHRTLGNQCWDHWERKHRCCLKKGSQWSHKFRSCRSLTTFPSISWIRTGLTDWTRTAKIICKDFYLKIRIGTWVRLKIDEKRGYPQITSHNHLNREHEFSSIGIGLSSCDWPATKKWMVSPSFATAYIAI